MKRTAAINIICSFIAVIVFMLATMLVLVLTGILDIGKNEIRISSASATEEYTGKPLVSNDWTLVSGKLKEGHELVVEITGSQTAIGMSENYAYATVVDETGKDVSADYSIEYDLGVLKVKQRKITVVANSAYKVYDGDPLVEPGHTVVPASALLKDHRVVATVVGSQTEIGSSENIISAVSIQDADGEDVSKYYNISTATGTLLVADASDPLDPGGSGNPSDPGDPDIPSDPDDPSGPITPPDTVMATVKSSVGGRIYLKSASYGDYNGSGFGTAVAYTVLLGDKSAYYLVPYALSNSGQNTATAEIDPMGNDFLIPYYTESIYYSPSERLVQSSDTLMSGDGSRKYAVRYYNWSGISGIALPNAYTAYEAAYRSFVYSNYLAVDSETRDYMQGIISAKGFSPTSSMTISRVAEYIKNAADYNLEYDTGLDSEQNVVIAFLDQYKEGVCRHYAAAATMLYRTLGIPARYTVGYAVETEANVETEVKASMAHAWVEVYIDGIGWVNVEVTGSAAGQDAPINLVIGLNNISAQYTDGATLTATVDNIKGFTISDKGYRYEAIVDGSISVPGKAISSVAEFEIYNSDNELVYQKSTGLGSDKFIIRYETGTVQLYLDTLVYSSAAVNLEKVYDGTALKISDSDCRYVSGTLAPGYTVVIKVGDGVLNVGQGLAMFTVVVYKDGVDCTSHYNISSIYGKLTVTPRSITVTANSATKPYDGTPLVCDGITYDPSALAPGDVIESYTVTGSITTIGYCDSTAKVNKIVNSSGVDVTKNYTVTYKVGRIQVTVR